MATRIILKIKNFKLKKMVDPNSPEFQIGKKIGCAFMTYIGIRIMIKGGKITIKSLRALLSSPVTNPVTISLLTLK